MRLARGRGASASQVVASAFLTTLVDQRVDVSTDGIDFFIDQARLEAVNGNVHVLETVLAAERLF